MGDGDKPGQLFPSPDRVQAVLLISMKVVMASGRELLAVGLKDQRIQEKRPNLITSGTSYLGSPPIRSKDPPAKAEIPKLGRKFKARLLRAERQQ